MYPLDSDAGQSVPDIYATSSDGKVVKLSDLRGKVIIVVFFDHWFETETPAMLDHLNKIATKFDKSKVVILPVSDQNGAKVQGFNSFEEWKIKRPLASLNAYFLDQMQTPDNQSRALRYYSDQMVVIGKDGNLVGHVHVHFLAPDSNDRDFDEGQLFNLVSGATSRGN